MYIYKVNNVHVQAGELSWERDVYVSSRCAAALILAFSAVLISKAIGEAFKDELGARERSKTCLS